MKTKRCLYIFPANKAEFDRIVFALPPAISLRSRLLTLTVLCLMPRASPLLFFCVYSVFFCNFVS